MKNISAILSDAGITHEVVEHEPVYTVADVARHMPHIYPVKNLLLKEEKGERCIFVIMKGDERLDTKALQSRLESRKLQFAKPEVLLQKLGVEPGSASLFSVLHDTSSEVEIVIDSRLKSVPMLGFHPSMNTTTIFIAGNDIATFLSAVGKDYRELSL